MIKNIFVLLFLFVFTWNVAAQESKQNVDTSEEQLFDAGEPPFITRVFGLNYPVYKPAESPERYRLYLLFGPYSPKNLCSSSMCFNDFFGNSKRIFANFEFEFELYQYVAGVLGLKTGTGFLIAQANGIFSNSTVRSRDSFTFFVIPIELLAVQTFKIWREQLLVPYLEAGISYFGFFQTRDNGGALNGGRANFAFGFGLKFLLNWLNYRGAWKLDAMHGINRTYLIFSYRMISAMSKGRSMDFSGSMLLFGVGFDM